MDTLTLLLSMNKLAIAALVLMIGLLVLAVPVYAAHFCYHLATYAGLYGMQRRFVAFGGCALVLCGYAAVAFVSAVMFGH